jgi:hypothetical protein
MQIIFVVLKFGRTAKCVNEPHLCHVYTSCLTLQVYRKRKRLMAEGSWWRVGRELGYHFGVYCQPLRILPRLLHGSMTLFAR